MNDQQASNWWIGVARAKQNAIHQVQLLFAIGTRCTSTCISMTYFMDWGNSHVSHNQNQANVTIKQKNTSFTKLFWVHANEELHNMPIDIRLAYKSSSKFSQVWSASGRFFCFLWQKRAREWEFDLFPLQKITSNDVILAHPIRIPVTCVIASCQSMSLKQRTLRKSKSTSTWFRLAPALVSEICLGKSKFASTSETF